MPVQIASAVVIRDGKVLLVQQRKRVAYGLWSFPGGHVEPGETPLEAVVREVREEIGVEFAGPKLFLRIPLESTEVGKIQMDYSCFTGQIPGILRLNDDELLAYGWFSLESLELMKDRLRTPMIIGIAKEALVLDKRV